VSPKRLPVVSGARVVRALQKGGFGVIGTKGSHCKLRRGSRTVIVPCITRCGQELSRRSCVPPT
jgi:predicted RNA binding protein YcfA (HicA-like mRNA interferase family)